jgi:phosphonate transport system substrate-binding protein
LGEIIDAGGHDKVILAVYNGECQAGASWVDARSTIEGDHPDVKDKVSVISESAPIPNDSFCYISSMSESDREKLTNAFLDLVATEEGREIFYQPQDWEGLEPVDDGFYDGFRRQLEAAGVSVEELAE